MSKRASSEEMEYNHNVVKQASNSIKNNNSSGYGKSLAQQKIETVSCSTKNVERLCNEIANKNKKQLERM